MRFAKEFILATLMLPLLLGCWTLREIRAHDMLIEWWAAYILKRDDALFKRFFETWFREQLISGRAYVVSRHEVES